MWHVQCLSTLLHFSVAALFIIKISEMFRRESATSLYIHTGLAPSGIYMSVSSQPSPTQVHCSTMAHVSLTQQPSM